MRKELPIPLSINCKGLSPRRIQKLVDILPVYFSKVEVWDDEITAGKPKSLRHYEDAWRMLDRYEVKVTL